MTRSHRPREAGWRGVERLETRRLLAANLLPDLAGNSAASARDLGELLDEAPLAVRDSVRHRKGAKDVDFYRFTLSQKRRVTVDLWGLKQNADVALRKGRAVVGRSTNAAGSGESISAELEAGTYRVQVWAAKGAGTNYRMKIRGETMHIPNAPEKPRRREDVPAMPTEPEQFADPPLPPCEVRGVIVELSGAEPTFAEGPAAPCAHGALSASLGAEGVLTVTGTSGEDRIVVRLAEGRYRVTGVSETFPREHVKAIVVEAKEGNDQVVLDVPGDAAAEAITVPVVVQGGEGDDTIVGSAGTDVLAGGAGDDVIFGLGASDVIDGNLGDDVLAGGDGADVMDAGPGKDRLVGGNENDTLVAGPGDDSVDAAEGNDRVEGGAGNDLLRAGAGDDVVLAGAGMDTVFGGDGNDRLDLDEDVDRGYGEGGSDTIAAGGGNDEVVGGAGADTVAGGAGDDYLYGEEGNDKLLGEGGADWLYGGDSGDELYGGDGGDRLYGGAGNDDLYGGGSVDTLRGEDGYDDFYDSVWSTNDDFEWFVDAWPDILNDFLPILLYEIATAMPATVAVPPVVFTPPAVSAPTGGSVPSVGTSIPPEIQEVLDRAARIESGRESVFPEFIQDTIREMWGKPIYYR